MSGFKTSLISRIKRSQSTMSSHQFRVIPIRLPIHVNNHAAVIEPIEKLLLCGGEVWHRRFGQKLMKPPKAHAHVSHYASSGINWTLIKALDKRPNAPDCSPHGLNIWAYLIAPN